MRLKLAPRWIRLLLEEPESGMGYQRVDVRFTDGRYLENAVAFNAEHLEVPEAFADAEGQVLKMHRN
jgi:hypothetical protein